MPGDSLDIIIKNVLVIDGTNKSAFHGSLAIKNGLISEIKENEDITKKAEKIIDGKKLSEDGLHIVVSPSFIDMHSHSDLAPLIKKDNRNEMAKQAKVSQGISTELVGQDGFSAAPISDDLKESYSNHWSALTGILPYKEWSWNSIKEYLEFINSKSTVRIETLVGHSTLRINVIGYIDQKPTNDELSKMKKLLEKSLRDGAVGLSLGLIYPPGMFAEEDELVELAKVVAKESKILVAHIRNESEKIISAIDEFLRIGKKSGCHLHISHFKICGKNVQKKYKSIMKKLNTAVKNGQKLSFDMYPYDAGSTTLQAILPPWAQKGSPMEVIERLSNSEELGKMAADIFSSKNTSWDNFVQMSKNGLEGITISDAPDSHKQLIGNTLQQIGLDAGFNLKNNEGKIETFGLIAKHMVETELNLAMISFNQDFMSVMNFLRLDKWLSIGTDGVLGRKPHPRLFGAITKFLRLSRESNLKSIELAIHQITNFPATLMNISNRGILKVGSLADLVIFDRSKVKDTCTYDEPNNKSQGILYLIINGKIVYHSNSN